MNMFKELARLAGMTTFSLPITAYTHAAWFLPFRRLIHTERCILTKDNEKVVAVFIDGIFGQGNGLYISICDAPELPLLRCLCVHVEDKEVMFACDLGYCLYYTEDENDVSAL